ncbi:MAG: polyphosphate kinase 2, partial [Saprospiraceae bacterium]|nr:polyphosphate kinase 2 [Saprospiraceae bacterium]
DTLEYINFREEIRRLQIELIHLQNWVVDQEERVLILFEGAEFAGKGTAIRAFMDHLNPRSTRLVALPKPKPSEEGQWYFQRYVMQLPKPGEMVFFDRSWYNRALVEPVNDFCTRKQYQQFMHDVLHFENMICNDGIRLIKIYLSISKTEQAHRIELVRANPLRRWELSNVDLNAQGLWDRHKVYEKKMLKLTNTNASPWVVVDGNDKFRAQLLCLEKVLKIIPYKRQKKR